MNEEEKPSGIEVEETKLQTLLEEIIERENLADYKWIFENLEKYGIKFKKI